MTILVAGIRLGTKTRLDFLVEHWTCHLLARTRFMTAVLNPTLVLSTQAVLWIHVDHVARAVHLAAIRWLLRHAALIVSTRLVAAPCVWRQGHPMLLALLVIEPVPAIHINDIITTQCISASCWRARIGRMNPCSCLTNMTLASVFLITTIFRPATILADWIALSVPSSRARCVSTILHSSTTHLFVASPSRAFTIVSGSLPIITTIKSCTSWPKNSWRRRGHWRWRWRRRWWRGWLGTTSLITSWSGARGTRLTTRSAASCTTDHRSTTLGVHTQQHQTSQNYFHFSDRKTEKILEALKNLGPTPT